MSDEPEERREEAAVWQRKGSEQVADCRVFRVRRDRSTSTRDEGREHDFYVIESPDWVNVVALTPEEEVVLIEQYRHGSGEIILEIPGGMVDAGETPRESAARELLEETGYAPRELLLLGRARPNPAIQDNWIYTFLARDVTFKSAPAFDSTEHVVSRLVPLASVPRLIADGRITHALVLVGFHFLSLYKSGLVAAE